MSDKRFVLSYEKGNEAIFEDRKDVYPKRMTNKEVENKLNEQQATIRKLQDLCGESDGENAKLRIENKRLQEENEQLKADEKLYAKEILQLKEELKEKEIVKLGGDY